MTLTIVGEFSEGYGRQIAFSARDDLWVTVETAQFHVWRSSERLYSIPLGGHSGGNPRFSRDGRWLFLGTRIFDLSQRSFVELPPLDSALVAEIDAQANPRADLFEISSTAWSPDGEDLVIYTQYRPPRLAGRDWKYTGPWKRVLLLKGQTRQYAATLLKTNTSEEYNALDVSDNFIAAGGLAVIIWHRGVGERAAVLEGSDVFFRDVRFNGEGSLLAGAAWDGKVTVWEARNWGVVASWVAHEDFARCLAFHPHQSLLASGGGDSNLNLWRISANAERVESLNVGAKVIALAFQPNGEGLAAALDDGRLLLCRYSG